MEALLLLACRLRKSYKEGMLIKVMSPKISISTMHHKYDAKKMSVVNEVLKHCSHPHPVSGETKVAVPMSSRDSILVVGIGNF